MFNYIAYKLKPNDEASKDNVGIGYFCLYMYDVSINDESSAKNGLSHPEKA
jgi:hypothetical protein